MLELRALQYHPATSRRPVLENINLTLPVGQPALVAGRSGSGKTTLLEVISGLSDADNGSITWDGELLTSRQRRWICGLVGRIVRRWRINIATIFDNRCNK